MDPEDDLFVDPEDAEDDEEAKIPEEDVEPEDPEQQEEEDDEEEDDEEDKRILAAWMSQCRAVEKEKEKEGEKTEKIDRRSFDPPSRPRADRRASLPCPAQLSAMQLSRLHSATKAPTPARALRTRNQDDLGPAMPVSGERRRSVIAPIPEVPEVPERKARFRRRNVMSLSDADRICLICYDDLNNGGSGVRELHCSHCFHSECIEEWLWRKQACPTCRVQVPMPQPLYWSSAQVKVP